MLMILEMTSIYRVLRSYNLLHNNLEPRLKAKERFTATKNNSAQSMKIDTSAFDKTVQYYLL